jgi:hypothetical protein
MTTKDCGIQIVRDRDGYECGRYADIKVPLFLGVTDDAKTKHESNGQEQNDLTHPNPFFIC